MRSTPHYNDICQSHRLFNSVIAAIYDPTSLDPSFSPASARFKLVIAVSLNLRPDLQAISTFIGATCARTLVRKQSTFAELCERVCEQFQKSLRSSAPKLIGC